MNACKTKHKRGPKATKRQVATALEVQFYAGRQRCGGGHRIIRKSVEDTSNR